jgi:hypothetical protein
VLYAILIYDKHSQGLKYLHLEQLREGLTVLMNSNLKDDLKCGILTQVLEEEVLSRNFK